jgi:hypothetical protein
VPLILVNARYNWAMACQQHKAIVKL